MEFIINLLFLIMITETSQKTVKSLFTTDDKGNSYKYIIPPYQREYSWKEEQWESLFNDIYENEAGYFLGSIICISSETNELDVIDGQQRLTTLSILLLSLYEKLSHHYNDFFSNKSLAKKFLDLEEYFLDDNDFRISPSIQNNNEEDYYYLAGKILDKKHILPKNYGNRRIAKAFKYFSERIELEIADFDIDDKIKFLFLLLDKISSSLIVKINTRDASSAFVLFESINNRGMVLTPIDLIKNTLISKLGGNQPGIINNEWQEVIKNVNDYESQVRFLRHYYNIFSNLNKYKFNVKCDEVNKATKSTLIKIYSEIIKNNGSELIKDLIDKSTIYNNLIEPRHICENSNYANYKTSLENLNRIGAVPANALLLYLFEYHNDKDLSGIIKFLEKWFIIRHITNTPSTNKLDGIFIEMIKLLDNHGTLDDVMESLLAELPEKKIIENKLITSNIYDFSSNLTKCLLVNIERNLLTKESVKDYWALNTENGSRQPKPVWTVEHIYPRNPKKGDIDEECEDLKDTLGNLTITAYNGNLSNRSYAEKLVLEKEGKEIGFNSENIKINELLKDEVEWKSSNIETRGKWLVEKFLEGFL